MLTTLSAGIDQNVKFINLKTLMKKLHVAQEASNNKYKVSALYTNWIRKVQIYGKI